MLVPWLTDYVRLLLSNLLYIELQIATLNFLDAFLRTRSQVVVPRDAFTAVELWMGIVHVYSCQDSLSTCQVNTLGYR